MDACQRGPYRKAYLVLGGIDSIPGSKQGGWTLRQWYLSGELKQFLNYHPLVEIIHEGEQKLFLEILLGCIVGSFVVLKNEKDASSEFLVVLIFSQII